MKTTLMTFAAAASLAAPLCTFADDPYVGSEGKNVICTDYYANPNTRIELDFQYTTGGGMVVSPWASGCGMATALWSNGNNLEFIVGNDTKFVGSGHTRNADRRFLAIDCHTGELRMATHNASTTNTIASGATFTASANWPVSFLCSVKSTDGTTTESAHFAKARIYGCKIYEWSETAGKHALVRNYVPMLHDGQPCLYDTVNDTFAVDPRSGAVALNCGGDIQNVSGVRPGYIQTVAKVGLNTGYKMNAKSRVELDAALASSTAEVRPMGCWDGTSAMKYLVWTNGRKNQFFLNSGSSSGSGAAIDTGRHTWVFDAPNKKGLYLTGETLISSIDGTATPAEAAIASCPISIFADTANMAGTKWSQPAVGMKCYGLKIYEGGNLVTNFVPYVRNGEIGLRDTITGAFLSANTTNFVAGGNLTLSGPTARDAFVESDGTQVLNTGYHVGRQTRVEVDFAVRAGTYGFLFGNYAYSGFRWCAWLASNAILNFTGGSSGSGTDIMKPGPKNERIKAVYDVKNAKGWVVRDGVAGEKKSITGSSLAEGQVCAYPMGVFGGLANADGTAKDTSVGQTMPTMRVYSVRIYEGDDAEPVREFLPYKGTEGVGLYDTKTGKLALKHSASVADPTIGGMGVDGAEKWLVEPQDETVACSKSVTLKAKAAGAISYKWTQNGEAVEGGTDGSLEVAWHRSKTPDTYTVTPVYNVFGAEVDGEPKTVEVTNEPQGLMIIVR